MTDPVWDDRCVCGHIYGAHEEYGCVVTFYGRKLSCPDGCREFVSPCRHAIYHHGCPSCDAIDPEETDRD